MGLDYYRRGSRSRRLIFTINLYLYVQLFHHPVEKTEDGEAEAKRYSRRSDPAPDTETLRHLLESLNGQW